LRKSRSSPRYESNPVNVSAMLERPTRKPKRKRTSKARQHRERQHNYVARVRNGRRCASVEYDDRTLDLLIRLHRLPKADAHGRAAIDAAITAALLDYAAKAGVT
jgi:hypothetical protein